MTSIKRKCLCVPHVKPREKNIQDLLNHLVLLLNYFNGPSKRQNYISLNKFRTFLTAMVFVKLSQVFNACLLNLNNFVIIEPPL